MKLPAAWYLRCRIGITQVRTAGGWEQVNFNTRAYSDPRVVATWNGQEACTRCFGQGYVTRQAGKRRGEMLTEAIQTG